MKIKIISGANLNMLGLRGELYGTFTLKEMEDRLLEYADDKGIELEFFRSNHEGQIIDEIHRLISGYDGLIINAGAYSHYSYAIADALDILKIPKIEVHLTDIRNREEFRAKLVTAISCDEIICGKGIAGYIEAIDKIAQICSK